MSTAPATKLRFRWTKRMTARAEIVFVVERNAFTLNVGQRGDEWVASVWVWSKPEAQQETSCVGLDSKRTAQLWAESQVTT